MRDHRTDPATDEATSAAKPECRALVPSAPFIERRSRRRWYRWSPDPIFVTHLIAQAQQAPQTRRVRRASMVDAQAAYRLRQAPAQEVGGRTRQIV
jgi:hypothetical protein